MPCYNHGEFVREALNSVLEQTYEDFEVIIVDDGSDDKKTKAQLKNIHNKKTKIINIEHSGLPAARNAGIKKAVGEYILPLDADDKIAPKFLERAANILDRKKNVGIVGSYYETFGAESWIARPTGAIEDEIVENQLIATCMFRKKDWEKVGGYKKNMKYGWEDHDLWLSFLEIGQDIYVIPEIMFYYRKHRPKDTGREFSLASIDQKKELELRRQLIKNHPKLYAKYPDAFIKHIIKLKYSIQDLQKENYLLRNNRYYKFFKTIKNAFKI